MTQTQTPTETPTQTPTRTPTATPTVTPIPPCPLTPGAYTITQTRGNAQGVHVRPVRLPPGGTIVQDVAAGAADCVHDTVVPFPGGFSAPTFCVPALGYSVHIDQTGCGVGKIDSDGGSDFTVTELGDTSDSSATCSLPNAPCSPVSTTRSASTSPSATARRTPAPAAARRTPS